MPNRHRPACRDLAATVPTHRGDAVPGGSVFGLAPRRFAPGEVGFTPATRGARGLTSDLGAVRAAAVPKLGDEVPRRHPNAARDGHGRMRLPRRRASPNRAATYPKE